MTRTWKFIILLVALLVASAMGGLVACASNESGVWSDAEMTQYFQDNRAQFKQLVGLLKEDPRIVSMSGTYDEENWHYNEIKITDVSGQQVSGRRAQQVRDLWRELNLKSMSYSDGEFVLREADSPDDGPYKALVYTASPPRPLVRTETSVVVPGSSVYRALGDGWYIDLENAEG